MSLIADALSKAGQPKTAPQAPAQAPASQEKIPSLPTATPPSSPGWTRGALVAICLGFSAALFVLSLPKARPNPMRLASSSYRSEPPIVSTNSGTAQEPLGLALLRTGPWRLNGIVQGGHGRSVALINNRVVEEGESIQGARVVKVAQDWVELESSGKRQTLQLQ